MRLRRRRYHTGGGIPPHSHPHEVLDSLVDDSSKAFVSEATQPAGNIPPRDPFSKPINIIPRPDTLSEASDDAFEPISWLELFSDPVRAFRFYNQNPQFSAAANIPGYEGRFEPFRRPTKAEFDATESRAIDFAGQVFNPATYAQTAVELDKDLTELDREIIAAFEDGRLSGSDLDRVGGQLTEAGLKTLFLVGGASMLRGSGVGSFKVPASGTQQQTGALQQLAGESQLLLPSAKSAAPTAVTETTPTLQQLAKKYQAERGIRTKKGAYVSEEAPYLESNIAKGGQSIDTGGFDPVPGVVQNVENLGVYQFPGLIKGSKLEKSVKAKDGTISKSVVEDYANDLPKNSTREKNAILNALVELDQEFPGKTIDYEALRSYVSLNIEPATVIKTKDQANYGLAKLDYDINVDLRNTPKTLIYQDESLGIAPPHPGMKDGASYWIRSFVNPDESEIYYVTEWQTDLQKLKTPDDLIKAPVNVPTTFSNRSFNFLIDDWESVASNGIEGFMYQMDAQKYAAERGVLKNTFANMGISRVPGLKQIEEITLDLPLIVFDDQPLISQLHDIGTQIESLDQKIYNAEFNLGAKDPSIVELREQRDTYELAFDEGMFELKKVKDEFDKNLPNRDALIKEEVNLRKSQIESLKLKWINESMLDAARNGQTILRIPTPETSRRIQGHGNPNRFKAVHRKYKDFPKYYKKEFGVEVREVTDDRDNTWWEVDIPEKYFNQNMMYMEGEVKTPSEFKTYKKGGILQAMAKKNRSDKNKFVSKKVKVLRKEGKSLKQAVAIALSMWERKNKKKFGAGGAISDFGVQTTFSTDFVEDSTDVAELEDPSEEVLATSDPELENPELTEQEIKDLKKKKALQSAGKGAAVGASIGSAIPVVGTAVGAVVGGLIGGLGSLLSNKGVEDPELIMAKNGVKVHKKKRTFDKGGLLEALKQRKEKIDAAKEYYKEESENPTMYLDEEGKIMMPDVSYETGEPVYREVELTPQQYKRFNMAKFREFKRNLRKRDRDDRRQERRDERIFDDGGLFEALREKRAQRRLGRTTIQPYDTAELGGSAGIFNQYLQEVQGIPRRSIALDPETSDDSVLTHELIHTTQFGPLQQIAAELDFKDAGRIQDKDTRKAFRKLYKSIDPKTQSLNRLGKFMVGGKERDIEFDAVIKSAISSAKKRGYDLSGKTYDEILNTLSKARDEDNISLNMRHLGNFMNSDKETGNTWTDEQKGYIMDAIKSNLDFEGYTAEDAKQDLR